MVAGHEVYDTFEFTELALGIDRELFAGLADETDTEHAARLDAARDVLTDLTGEDPELAAYAQFLMRQAPVPLRRPAPARRRTHRAGVAA
ncbi:hypothetical protein [Streptacidiphilus sp. MAP5-3]|uniref:hypothetical protein n=1 Tax=unclassified Streptacidiphilus TaxID=2643834 RepID=UPI0035129B71